MRSVEFRSKQDGEIGDAARAWSGGPARGQTQAAREKHDRPANAHRLCHLRCWNHGLRNIGVRAFALGIHGCGRVAVRGTVGDVIVGKSGGRSRRGTNVGVSATGVRLEDRPIDVIAGNALRNAGSPRQGNGMHRRRRPRAGQIGRSG